jgi:hypothetical protein
LEWVPPEPGSVEWNTIKKLAMKLGDWADGSHACVQRVMTLQLRRVSSLLFLFCASLKQQLIAKMVAPRMTIQQSMMTLSQLKVASATAVHNQNNQEI